MNGQQGHSQVNKVKNRPRFAALSNRAKLWYGSPIDPIAREKAGHALRLKQQKVTLPVLNCLKEDK